MQAYILKRLLTSIPVLFGVSIIVFVVMNVLPGDPAQILLGSQEVTPQQLQRLREQLHLDDPLHVRYLTMMGGALRGDLGRSIRSDRPVIEIFMDQFPSTLELTIAALIASIAIGVVAGIIAAVRQYSALDNLSMLVALLGVSMPSFWLGLLLIFVFALGLGWLPATGTGGPERLLLPALTLGVGGAGVIARLVRSSMLEVLRMEYVTTARAKGLSEHVVVLHHALRNALIPVVTVVGLEVGRLLSGAFVVEVVFSRPGIGRIAIQAINFKDYTIVQGIVLYAAALYVVVNLAVDIVYAYLDPRIRYS
ncbi:MAG: ABC transporter permease [Chloroflexi bacterium]|nr:ABC transporter permease [Chloroflexota bacterium]